MLIFVIQENEIFISVIRDRFFFIREPCQKTPCTTLKQMNEIFLRQKIVPLSPIKLSLELNFFIELFTVIFFREGDNFLLDDRKMMKFANPNNI